MRTSPQPAIASAVAVPAHNNTEENAMKRLSTFLIVFAAIFMFSASSALAANNNVPTLNTFSPAVKTPADVCKNVKKLPQYAKYLQDKIGLQPSQCASLAKSGALHFGKVVNVGNMRVTHYGVI